MGARYKQVYMVQPQSSLVLFQILLTAPQQGGGKGNEQALGDFSVTLAFLTAVSFSWSRSGNAPC